VRGDGGKRRDVRGGVGAIRRGCHDERRAVASHDELAGGVGADHGKRPRTLQATAGVTDRGEQVSLAGAGPGLLNEVGDDLGVGVRLEGVAIAREIALELAEVLDDAVVRDGDADPCSRDADARCGR